MSSADDARAPKLPAQLVDATQLSYRSVGLGIYAVVVRYSTMPFEKIAMIMNSSQVSGSNQLQQASRIVFSGGLLTPYRTVGRASIVAWFFQYSVMGFIFQICDRSLSHLMGVRRVVYGAELMEPPKTQAMEPTTTHPKFSAADEAKFFAKAGLAPALAGGIESLVCNRAEAQRFYGIPKLAAIETQLNWNAVARACGPGFVANASRNFVMSATSFVATPTLYQRYFPQEKKSQSSLFWFGLAVNIFGGNVVAITQQALWGRSLDYGAVGGGRNISYGAVVREGLKAEGAAAFFTLPKWFSRVMMNAPIQGTVPWFYNEILPFGEPAAMRAASWLYQGIAKRGREAKGIPQ